MEEIKKKTNYYSTRDLLQKYDENSPTPTPLRPKIVPPSDQPQTPQRQPLGPSQNVNRTPVHKSLQSQLSRSFASLFNFPITHATPSTAIPSSYPAGLPRKQWYDKLADAILGDDEQTLISAKSRYALICEKCFAHNGLVQESMWEDTRESRLIFLALFLMLADIEYVCPKCNHFNASVRAKHQGNSASQVSTPSSLTSPLQALPNTSIIRRGSPFGRNVPPDHSSHDAPVVDGGEMEVDS